MSIYKYEGFPDGADNLRYLHYKPSPEVCAYSFDDDPLDESIKNADGTPLGDYFKSLVPPKPDFVQVFHPCFYPDFVGNSAVGVSPVQSELYETMCPVNPVTGFRDNALSRLFAPEVSNTEKQFILQNLTELQGVSSPKDLSDSEILSLIPSRYASDPVELQRYRDMVDALIEESRDRPKPDPMNPDSAGRMLDGGIGKTETDPGENTQP